MYNVSEDVGSVRVCYAVLSGRTATRSFYMGLSTIQGDAIGVQKIYSILIAKNLINAWAVRITVHGYVCLCVSILKLS